MAAKSNLDSFLFRKSTDQQILLLGAVSLVVLTFVALMLVPLGLPYYEHVVGYWWADEMFKDAVGQTHKFLWYKKSAYSFLFFIWILLSAFIWNRCLLGKSSRLILIWAYFVFCFSVIMSQFLVLGGWETHFKVNLMDGWDECPSIVKIVDKIDSPTEFLRDMGKYAGVNGELRGTLAIKPPGYVLMFYFIDKLGQLPLIWLGLDRSDLANRSVAMACGFLFLIGLFLFPMFHALNLVFSENLARAGLMILSLSPLVAHGFAHMLALGHHILLPISSLSLMLFVMGVSYKKKIYLVGSFIVLGLGGLIVWEAIAFSGILILAYFLVVQSRGDSLKKLNTRLLPIVLGLTICSLALVWIGSRLIFNVDIFRFFWDHFVVAHLFVHYKKIFITKGPIVYFLSIFTNVFCFSFFVGVSLAVMIWFSVRRSLAMKIRRLGLSDILVWATVIFVLILDLGGLSSETSRLWAFMAPAWYFVALRELSQASDRHSLNRIALVIYFLNGLQVLVERNVHYYI